jgi:hypothetical protein
VLASADSLEIDSACFQNAATWKWDNRSKNKVASLLRMKKHLGGETYEDVTHTGEHLYQQLQTIWIEAAKECVYPEDFLAFVSVGVLEMQLAMETSIESVMNIRNSLKQYRLALLDIVENLNRRAIIDEFETSRHRSNRVHVFHGDEQSIKSIPGKHSKGTTAVPARAVGSKDPVVIVKDIFHRLRPLSCVEHLQPACKRVVQHLFSQVQPLLEVTEKDSRAYIQKTTRVRLWSKVNMTSVMRSFGGTLQHQRQSIKQSWERLSQAHPMLNQTPGDESLSSVSSTSIIKTLHSIIESLMNDTLLSPLKVNNCLPFQEFVETFLRTSFLVGLFVHFPWAEL